MKTTKGEMYIIKGESVGKKISVVRVIDGKTINIDCDLAYSGDFDFDVIKSEVEKKKSMKNNINSLLALDLSTSCSGIAIFINKKYAHSENYRPTGDVFDRIKQVKERVSLLIKQYNIDYVVIEDIYYEKGKFNVFKVLTGLQYCVLSELHDMNVKYELISAKDWRKLAGIKTTNRDGAKKASIDKARTLYNIVNEDESEAINIALGILSR